MFLLHFNQYR